MTDSLKPKQALLILKLLLLGEEEPYALAKMRPRLLAKASERQELLDKGLLRATTKKTEQEDSPSKRLQARPSRVLIPTDKAWDWLADHLGHAMPEVPRNQAGISKLYGVLFLASFRRLASLIENERLSLAEFATADPSLRPDLQSTKAKIREQLLAACRRLSRGHHPLYIRVGELQKLLDHPWREVNEVLLELAKKGEIELHPCDTPLALTLQEKERAPLLDGIKRHIAVVEVA